MAGPLAEVLALGELLARMEPRGLRLWLGDVVLRAARDVFEYEGKEPDLEVGIEGLRRYARIPKPELLNPALAALDRAWMASEGRVAEVAEIARESGRFMAGEAVDLEEIARGARRASISTWANQRWELIDDEERWQARRLLWRLRLMPRGEDAAVRIDYADFRGLLPRRAQARARFEDLRARIYAEEDARMELILAFPEVMFAREFDAM